MKTHYRLALSIISGQILAFSWPTEGSNLFVFVAFVPLLFVESDIRKFRAKRGSLQVLIYAYITFAVWHSQTVSWIWNASLVGALAIVLGHSAILSVVFTAFHFVARRVNQKMGLLFFICIYICFEKLDLDWELSLPWLNLGNVFSQKTLWVQWYEYTGAFGGTLWILAVNVCVFLAIHRFTKHRSENRLYTDLAKTSLYVAIPIALSLIIYMCYKEQGKSINVAIFQPNIDPYTEKYNIPNMDALDRLRQTMNRHLDQKTTLAVTPETYLTNDIKLTELKSSEEAAYLSAALKEYPKLNLLLGATLVKYVFDRSGANEESIPLNKSTWVQYHNSALFLSPDNSEIGVYNKSKPLIGVEHMPYKRFLEPIFGHTLMNFGGSVFAITPQKERRIFKNSALKIGPIICYEAIYGEFIATYVSNGANVLAMLSNEGWWGDTQGHKQLFYYTKLRAIETRRSIVRSANTGISAIINQRGDIVKALPYNTEGMLKGSVNLNEKTTFYTTYGDYIPRIALLVACLIGLFSIAKKRKDVLT